jgi:hypothetical protein
MTAQESLVEIGRHNNRRKDPSHWPRDAFYLQKLALTAPTSGGRSVGIVHSRTEAKGLLFIITTQICVSHSML